MSARIWLLRRETKRLCRVWDRNLDVESNAFFAACRRLSDAADERDRRRGRLGRYANRRCVVWMAS